METKMILRDLRNADLKSLEDVIRKTWNYDKFTSSKTAKKLAKAYLASCLANQTYALTAEVDGKPVGIILGKNIENTAVLSDTVGDRSQPFAGFWPPKKGGTYWESSKTLTT